LQAKAAEIDELQQQMEQLEENQTNNNTVTDTQQVTKSDVATQNDQPDDTNQKTGDDLPPPSNADDDFLLQNMGPGLANTDDKGTTKDASDPFEVKGGTDTGFNVESKDGINVNESTIKSEEEANQLALELNNGRKDSDWATTFIGPIPDGDESVTDVIARMISRGNKSLQAYNKNREDKIETLQEYYAIPEGRDALEAIRESILTNTPLREVKAKRKKAKTEAGKQIDLFESTSTPSKTGPALTLESLSELDLEIKNLLTPFNQEALKDVESTAKALNEILDKEQSLSSLPYVEMKEGENFGEAFAKAYHNARANNSNPKLVKAVENLIILQSEKAELERRREEELDENLRMRETLAEDKDISDADYQKIVARQQANAGRIDAEYNAKLAAMSEKFSKFVGEDVVTEDMITDQMKQLGTCFK
jgi:hypothetical protein